MEGALTGHTGLEVKRDDMDAPDVFGAAGAWRWTIVASGSRPGRCQRWTIAASGSRPGRHRRWTIVLAILGNAQ